MSRFCQIIKKTRFPHWGEQLELELDAEEVTEGASLTLEVWDWDMVGKNDFLGKVSRLKFSFHTQMQKAHSDV